jgi:hypothetical protein
VEIPVPEGSRILGSLIYGTTSILFITALSPAQVQAFYRERLPAAGWSVPRALSGQAGFRVPPPAVERLLLFCQSARGLALQVMMDGARGPLTTVHLELDSDPPAYSPCRRRPDLLARREQQQRIEAAMPVLDPPPDTQPFDQGGSLRTDGESQAYQHAIRLHTEWGLAAVADHYRRQLEQAGWSCVSWEPQGPVVRSSWVVRDAAGQDWRGVFLVLAEAVAPRWYFLRWQAETAG